MGRKIRPVVRYHGGKFMHADWINSFFPVHDTYTEGFGGGGSVLLHKPRAPAEIYNDLDKTMVQLFRVLRGPRSEELVRAVTLTPFSREEFDLAYEPCEDEVEAARRTLVRSFMGYGSDGTTGDYKTGFRLYVSSISKLPAAEWDNYPKGLRYAISRFKRVVIENTDAMLLLPKADAPGTLHYVDPPYHPATRSQGNRRRGAGYHVYPHELDEAGHEALLKLLCQLDGMIVLSGYPHPSYDDNLPGWTRHERQAYADGGRPRVECLWINPAAQRAARRGGLFD